MSDPVPAQPAGRPNRRPLRWLGRADGMGGTDSAAGSDGSGGAGIGRRSRWSRRATVTVVGLVAAGVLASSMPAAAHPTYPSKQRVQAAKQAAASKAAQVKSIQATLARAADELTAAQNAA